ncbi:hypothetical protein POM88_045598 [Heracleum sosnowskyi]|uniref:Uncharacterized protein n=1 Tax=Heracleum sosnowskyi TaxID=360622 RepID=A0AAD8H7J9_9APIA|nr:hypothetical protein POM88_045598 [Heracleum sosnowskyi]
MQKFVLANRTKNIVQIQAELMQKLQQPFALLGKTKAGLMKKTQSVMKAFAPSQNHIQAMSSIAWSYSDSNTGKMSNGTQWARNCFGVTSTHSSKCFLQKNRRVKSEENLLRRFS